MASVRSEEMEFEVFPLSHFLSLSPSQTVVTEWETPCREPQIETTQNAPSSLATGLCNPLEEFSALQVDPLANRRQQDGETVEEYASDLKSLVALHPQCGEESHTELLRSFFIRGLRPEAAWHVITTQPGATYREAYRLAQAWEDGPGLVMDTPQTEIAPGEQRPMTATGLQTPHWSDKPFMHCSSCHTMGHVRTDCHGRTDLLRELHSSPTVQPHFLRLPHRGTGTPEPPTAPPLEGTPRRQPEKLARIS
jgi:hypothetical protein